VSAARLKRAAELKAQRRTRLKSAGLGECSSDESDAENADAGRTGGEGAQPERARVLVQYVGSSLLGLERWLVRSYLLPIGQHTHGPFSVAAVSILQGQRAPLADLRVIHSLLSDAQYALCMVVALCLLSHLLSDSWAQLNRLNQSSASNLTMKKTANKPRPD
jgi:hypothetical protein